MSSFFTRSGLGLAAIVLVLPLSGGSAEAADRTAHDRSAVRPSQPTAAKPVKSVESVKDATGDQRRRQPGWRQHPTLRKVADLTKLTITNDSKRRSVIVRHRLVKLGKTGARNHIWNVSTDLSRGKLKYQIYYSGAEDLNATFLVRDGKLVGTMCDADLINTRVLRAQKSLVTSVPWKCFRGSNGRTFKAIAYSVAGYVAPGQTAVQPVANDRTRSFQVPIAAR